MRSPHGLVTVPAPMSHVWGETIPAHSSVGSLRSTIYHVASLNNMRSYRNEMRNSCLYLERNGRCLYYGDGFSDLLKQSFSLSWITSKLCTKHMDGCSFLVQFWSDGWSRCTTILTLPGQSTTSWAAKEPDCTAGRSKRFSSSSKRPRPDLEPNHPPIRWVSGALPPGEKRQGREANYWPAPSGKVKNA